MALSLAQAITEVRDHLNEATAVFWSDAQITKWIQTGTRIASSKGLLVEADDDITLIANQVPYTSAIGAGYTWLADCLEPVYGYYNDQNNKYKGLVKITPRQIGNLATFTTGDPKYFCFFNRSMYIFPLTTAAIVTVGGTVSFLYGKETDDITALSDEYQHLSMDYALARAKYRDHHFAEANAMLAQFYQDISFERQDKVMREQDTLDSFKIKPSALGGGGQRA